MQQQEEQQAPHYYVGPERRSRLPLSDDQIEAIAERAAAVALEKVYTNIGRSVVSRFIWLVGACTLAIAAWLSAHGILK